MTRAVVYFDKIGRQTFLALIGSGLAGLAIGIAGFGAGGRLSIGGGWFYYEIDLLGVEN